MSERMPVKVILIPGGVLIDASGVVRGQFRLDDEDAIEFGDLLCRMVANRHAPREQPVEQGQVFDPPTPTVIEHIVDLTDLEEPRCGRCRMVLPVFEAFEHGDKIYSEQGAGFYATIRYGRRCERCGHFDNMTEAAKRAVSECTPR